MTDETTEENSDETLKETLKKRLELELGLPLTPQSDKIIEQSFDDNVILVEHFPIVKIKVLKIGNETLDDEDYILKESEGCIYLTQNYNGLLYLEYCYGLPENEYLPLLDLMMDYETDTSWKKDASSISEKNVSVSYDTSQGKGARIQSMIEDLRYKYSCVVEMI